MVFKCPTNEFLKFVKRKKGTLEILKVGEEQKNSQYTSRLEQIEEVTIAEQPKQLTIDISTKNEVSIKKAMIKF